MFENLTESSIRFLFSGFRSRASNPEGFDNKLNWWIGAINEICTKEKRYHFNVIQLSEAFKSHNTIPDLDCLRLVASELIRGGKLVTRECFVNNINTNNLSLLLWLMTKLHKWLIFLLVKIGQRIGVKTMDQTISYSMDLVNIEAVVIGSKDLMAFLGGQRMTNKCIKYEDFERSIGEMNIESDQLEILLLYLASIKQVVTMEHKGSKYCKFGDNSKFSDFDLSLQSLKSARHLIEDDIVKIESEIEKCSGEAIAAVKSSSKIKAKSLLRRKKRLEDVLLKKESQLDNINCIAEQLLVVQSSKAVFNAYQECSGALRAAQLTLVPDQISDTIAELAVMLDNNKNIVLNVSLNVKDVECKNISSVIADEKLEAELAEIMELEKDTNERMETPKVSDDKIDELYRRLENLRRSKRKSSLTNSRNRNSKSIGD